MADGDTRVGSESLADARLEGIGEVTAQHLAEVGVVTVADLAGAATDRLVDDLATYYERWKRSTLHERVSSWVALAADRLSHRTTLTSKRHVFLVSLWTDSEGHTVRSRFAYRNPDDAAAEEVARDTVGWSPIAFARFVRATAELTAPRDLTEERSTVTEYVEWSTHYVEGELVRGDGSPVVVQATIPSDELGSGEGHIRWRASGELIPFGRSGRIAVGTLHGEVAIGQAIALAFPSRTVDRGLYRARFTLSVSPPAGTADLTATPEGLSVAR